MQTTHSRNWPRRAHIWSSFSVPRRPEDSLRWDSSFGARRDKPDTPAFHRLEVLLEHPSTKAVEKEKTTRKHSTRRCLRDTSPLRKRVTHSFYLQDRKRSTKNNFTYNNYVKCSFQKRLYVCLKGEKLKTTNGKSRETKITKVHSLAL